MFCPNCGQRQVSNEIKFCSRCGLPLGLISEVHANGGSLPQLAELYKNKTLFARRNGVIFSLFWFMFFVLILTPFFGILDVDELAGMSAVLGTMGGLILLIASFVFLKKPTTLPNHLQNLPQSEINNLAGKNQSALPPQQTQPAQSYVPPSNSSGKPEADNFVRPGSVTEGTTKLLQKEE